MCYLQVSLCGIMLSCLLGKVWLLENGLARTPPMGWMSWGYFMCANDCEKNPEKCLNEQLIMDVADEFFQKGYLEAGYEYIIIDDCWSERQRVDGQLIPDKKRFPRGMKFLADYIHSRGLKFGMYTNIAAVTCMGYPGSRDHFKQDAQLFSEWDIDYLKVDGCFVEENYLDYAYKSLGWYLNNTGRPMVFSCSWPYYKEFIHNKMPDYTKITPHCNVYRNYHDVQLHWPAVKRILRFYEDRYLVLHQHHGPGHWNDPDMLVLGTNSLTLGQSRIQLAVYAMLSAPLLLSCNMSKITEEERKLLLNLDLMAIAQDRLGVMARPHKVKPSLTIWVKRHLPSKGNLYNTFSFALTNYGTKDESVFFHPGEYGLNSPDIYTVLDVFSGDFIRNITSNVSMEVLVPAQDVILYTFYAL